ncbi:hypothetical protein THAOC_29882, partial [Thalassiosira oceanica]
MLVATVFPILPKRRWLREIPNGFSHSTADASTPSRAQFKRTSKGKDVQPYFATELKFCSVLDVFDYAYQSTCAEMEQMQERHAAAKAKI